MQEGDKTEGKCSSQNLVRTHESVVLGKERPEPSDQQHRSRLGAERERTCGIQAPEWKGGDRTWLFHQKSDAPNHSERRNWGGPSLAKEEGKERSLRNVSFVNGGASKRCKCAGGSKEKVSFTPALRRDP